MPKRDISGRIVRAYEVGIAQLPIEKIGHFFYRAGKVLPKKEYDRLVFLFTVSVRGVRLRKALRKLRGGKRISHDRPADRSKLDRRRRERQELYHKYPRIPFFNELLTELFFIRKFGLDRKVFRREFSEALKLVRKNDFRRLYLRAEVLRQDSSFVFNAIAFLRFLGIASFEKEAEAMLRDIYIDKSGKLKKKIADWEFQSLIYSLTHIIISRSDYYEHPVSSRSWITAFFASHLEEIIRKTNLDILSEVGLCFRLCQEEYLYREELGSIRKYLLKNFDFSSLTKPAFLRNKEHTASILVLLFSEKPPFRKSGDISGSASF